MTRGDAMDLAEQLLRTWGRLVAERPDYPTPGPLLDMPRRDRDGQPPPSPQESWVAARYRELIDAAGIERFVAALPDLDRLLVFARYVEGRSIEEIARQLYMSRSAAYHRRERIVYALAIQLSQRAA